MKLLRPLPPYRTFEQLHRQYLFEKALAERLRRASRAERSGIYATMYEQLFREIPDHSRLSRRDRDRRLGPGFQQKLALVENFLTPATVFVEFAPGDCRVALEIARRVKRVYAIDISDQRGPGEASPDNFQLLVYDGFHVDAIPPGSVDLVFSNHFIEHLHPADTGLHFELAHRLLRPGGRYVFRTPQALTGPHDVSKFFSEEPEGLHLKEWTYRELRGVLGAVPFSRLDAIRQVRTVPWRLPYRYLAACETMLARLPRSHRQVLASYLVPSICVVAIK